jgi:hypothetical protein
MMDAKTEINYQINVQPKLFELFNEIAKDMSQYISVDDFIRAMWVYADRLLETEYTTAPLWLLQELETKRRQAEASMTVDGEVAGDG